jgi:hypothetical protein
MSNTQDRLRGKSSQNVQLSNASLHSSRRAQTVRTAEWKSRAFELSDPSGFLLTIYSETPA